MICPFAFAFALSRVGVGIAGIGDGGRRSACNTARRECGAEISCIACTKGLSVTSSCIARCVSLSTLSNFNFKKRAYDTPHSSFIFRMIFKYLSSPKLSITLTYGRLSKINILADKPIPAERSSSEASQGSKVLILRFALVRRRAEVSAMRMQEQKKGEISKKEPLLKPRSTPTPPGNDLLTDF